MKIDKHLLEILTAVLITIPGTLLFLTHTNLTPPLMALTTGVAILGASFILLWACDAAQADIPQALALAVVALIAVLPEYAVDMYFTWQAGKFPESDYPHYAIANMTGANRLLIGVAWVIIVAISWWRSRQPAIMEKERLLELRFLALATIYGFIIPLKGSLNWFDGCVFLCIYIWYIVLAGKRPCIESEAEGPAEFLIKLPKSARRLCTIVLFLIAATTIVTNAKPFSEGLIATGEFFHINKFLLVQWLAPIASEAPEFTVGIMFAWRSQAGLALGSLLSAKLNQWTLLVGMIPGVYAISHGTLEHPIPMNSFQMHEILLTAAQSLLAIILIANLRLTIGQSFLLFSLFTGQLITPNLFAVLPESISWNLSGERIHQIFSMIYVVSFFVLLSDNPKRLNQLWPWAKTEQL